MRKQYVIRAIPLYEFIWKMVIAFTCIFLSFLFISGVTTPVKAEGKAKVHIGAKSNTYAAVRVDGKYVCLEVLR